MSPIKGFFDRKRMRRIGIVRLGVKLISEKTGKEYPRATDYFVLDDAPGLVEIYGEKSRLLNILLLSDDEEISFPYYMMRYTGRGLRCMGDGDRILRRLGENGKWEVSRGVNLQTGEIEICLGLECPFAIRPQNGRAECQPTGRLRFLCADQPTLGYYQLTVRKRAIEGFLGQFEFATTVLGKLTGYPWRLVLEQEIVQLESGQRKMWIPQLEIAPTIFEVLLKQRQAGKPLALPEGLTEATPEMEKELVEDLDYEPTEEPFPEEKEPVKEPIPEETEMESDYEPDKLPFTEEVARAMPETKAKQVELDGVSTEAYYKAVEKMRGILAERGAPKEEIERFLSENLQGRITREKVEAVGAMSRKWEPPEPPRQPRFIEP